MMHAAKVCGFGGVTFTGLRSKACMLTAYRMWIKPIDHQAYCQFLFWPGIRLLTTDVQYIVERKGADMAC